METLSFDYKLNIRNWNTNFEQDRSRRIKNLGWVPIPNKQGIGYRKIMKAKNGLSIYASWIALVLVASKCSPRGDLSKYSVPELSDLTLIDQNTLLYAIEFLSQCIDWIEVVERDNEVFDIDGQNLSIDGHNNTFVRSVLCPSVPSSSVQFSSVQSDSVDAIDRVNTDNAPTMQHGEQKLIATAIWRATFEVYTVEHDRAYSVLINNKEWLEKMKHLNPDLDILLSMENAREFWKSEEGWRNKKGKKTKDLNWESTYRNAIRQPMNRVFSKQFQSKISDHMERKRAGEIPQTVTDVPMFDFGGAL